MEEKIVRYNGYDCRIIKEYYGDFYDLETINETELKIKEVYLSVHKSDIIEIEENI